MSITDELRERAHGFHVFNEERLLAIADRIDAEHEESIQREHESAYDAGYAEGMGVANKADMRAEYLRGKNDGYDEGWDAAAKTMTEHMVELPKDADGEYINADDEMFWKEDGDSAGRVTAIGVGQRAGWVWTLLDGCNVSTGHEAFRLRRHHAPTVEDVLTEFGIDWEHESDCEDRAALLKEYAKRLTLAEGEDA